MKNPFSFRPFALSVVSALLWSNLATCSDPASEGKTDWSKFTNVNSVTAEVRAVDGDRVTLRVYWTEAKATPSNSGGRSSSRSSRNRGRNSSPLQRMIQQARSRQPHIQLHEEHHDYHIASFNDTKVSGVKAVDGSPATTASLVPGMVVSAQIVRDKSVPLTGVTEADFRLKPLHVTGRNPNYKPDSGSSGKPAKKK